MVSVKDNTSSSPGSRAAVSSIFTSPLSAASALMLSTASISPSFVNFTRISRRSSPAYGGDMISIDTEGWGTCTTHSAVESIVFPSLITASTLQGPVSFSLKDNSSVSTAPGERLRMRLITSVSTPEGDIFLTVRLKLSLFSVVLLKDSTVRGRSVPTFRKRPPAGSPISATEIPVPLTTKG